MYKSLFAFTIGFALLAPPDHIKGAENLRMRELKRSDGSAGNRQSRGPAAGNRDSDYDVQRIPIPAGFTGGVAVDINNRGTVGGVLFAPDNRDITFLWSKGRLTEIRHPSAIITSVPSIADSGVLFGNWGSFTEQTAGFYHPASDTWTALPAIPGKPISMGSRANNAGQATGVACAGTWFMPVNCSIWFWNGKSYEYPVLPASPVQVLEGVNDRGQAVGRYLLAFPFDFRSFVLDRGGATEVILPNTKSSAYDINNQGQIVLNFEVDPNALFVPALYDRGNLELLPLFPGAFGTTWIGLNERGDISGLAYDDLSGFAFVYPIVGFRQ